MVDMTDAIPTKKPMRSKAEVKAETTDSMARAIIEAEIDQRAAKTLRLRQVRLERAAQQPPVQTKAQSRKTSRTRIPSDS
jgi:hypothetical protein